MSDKPQGDALDGLDGLDLTNRSSAVSDPKPEGAEKTVVDPTALTAGIADGPHAANDPRRALSSTPAAATLALPAGFRLFEYRIDSVLGQGGFGIAYAAMDVNLAAKAVVKEYPPEGFAFPAPGHSLHARRDMDP